MVSRVAAILMASSVSCASARNCSDAGPTLKMIIDIAPKCFEGCPQLCEPIESMVSEFMASGNRSVLEDMVCDAKDQFDCVFEPSNLPECLKVLAMDSAIGADLPKSQSQWEDYVNGCELTPQATTAEPTRVPATSIAAEAPCTGDNEMIKMVTAISPACFEECPRLCGALEGLLSESGGVPDPAAIEKQVCLKKEDFSCAFHPDNHCKAVLSAGATFNVPQTGAELSRRCSAAAGGASHDFLSAALPWTVVRAAPLLLAWAVHML